MLIHVLRDISVVILALEALILGLIPLAAFYLGARGMMALRRWLKPKAELVQGYAAKGQELVKMGSDKAAAAIIAPTAAATQAATMARATRGVARETGSHLARQTQHTRHDAVRLVRAALLGLRRVLVYVAQKLPVQP